jgi:hypothetical protein
MSENGKIKTFVRETLGCVCTDEVFKYIRHQDNFQLIDNLLLKNKINIGNRLLIYIVEIDDVKGVIEKVSTLIHIGKTERDKKGFNRFRLVIMTNNSDTIKQRIEKTFPTLNGVAEKAHLHVIHKSEYKL